MGLQKILETILNIIFLSLPESVVIVLLTLIISGNSHFISFKKTFLIKLAFITIPVSVFATLLRTFIPLSKDYMMFVAIIWISSLIVVFYKQHKFKSILKVLLANILALIIMSIFQLSYVPLLLYGTGKTADDMNKAGLLVFVWSLPERTFEIILLSLILSKKRSTIKIQLFKVLFTNKALSLIFVFLTLFNFSFIFIALKLIVINQILLDYTFTIQIFVIVLSIIFPISNMAMFLSIVYNITSREEFKKFLSTEKLRTLTSILEGYTLLGKYEKVDNVLSEISNQIDNIYYIEN